MKPYRVEYVRLAGWERDVVGLWLAENEDWLLLRQVPVDYVADGYVLLAKAHIAAREPRKGRKQTELVLRLKGIRSEVPAGFAFGGVVEMLRWVEQHYGLVEFADEEDSTFFGWIGRSDAVHFWPALLWPNGTTEADEAGEADGDAEPFVLAEIQCITFDTDYFRSLKLLWQHKQRRKLPKPSDN